jgi:glycosyltransferase involved in cell wall biosynthesis
MLNKNDDNIKVCLYAIAKNEVDEVESWYDSIKEADKIIVLDTGSTDGTQEKLKALGVNVYETTYPNRFRFDVARNDAMKIAYQTDCDVFLTIDLDERLNRGWCDIIKKTWDKNKHTRASYNYFYKDGITQGTRNWIHDRTWKWCYPCHEAMIRNDSIFYTNNESLNLCGKVIMRHYPKSHKSTRSQYLPLLEIRIKENPHECASWGYYIRELMYANQYDKMIESYNRIKGEGFLGAEWAWCLIWTSVAYEYNGEIDKAIALLLESIRVDKRFRTSYINLASILNAQGMFCMAEGVLKQGLKDTPWETLSMFLDSNDVWNWRYYDWLYVVCFNQHKTEEALKWISLALIEQPDNPILQTHYQSCIKVLQESR